MKCSLQLCGVIATALSASIVHAAEPEFANLVVRRFHSDVPSACVAADIQLSPSDAKRFFVRSRAVSSRTVHDDYDLIPCYLEGGMSFRGRPARWSIHLGGVATIVQAGRTRYYVCDACAEMFERK